MTIRDDPHQTRPVGFTRRLHTGPISRTNSGPLPDMDDHHVYRGCTSMPTRALHTATEAFHRANATLTTRGERQKIEMWCVLTDLAGRRERMIVAARVDPVRTGYYVQHRGVTLTAKGLAGIWRHMQTRWPAALEATDWQFAEFPHWDDAAWQAMQDRTQGGQP